MNEHLVDRIARFCGSLPFFYLNAVWFGAWLLINGLTPFRFDGYPFAFLTLSVSLEAIFLSIFVLISQNRQAEADRAMEVRDCQINEKAEKEIRLLMEQQRQLRGHQERHRTHLHQQDEALQEILARLTTKPKPLPRVRRKKDEVIQ